MQYFNVHSHQPSRSAGEITIVNTIVKEETAENHAPYRSYGIHPWYISDVEKQMEQLRHYALLKETIAIGEAGLDKLTETDLVLQTDVFRQQALLAEEISKPMIIHCVKAWTEIMALKQEITPRQPWVIHGFRGKPELAHQLTTHGFLLSFGEKFNPEALRQTRPESVLAETDESTQPIAEIYRKIAASLSLSIDVVASTLAENSRHIFCL